MSLLIREAARFAKEMHAGQFRKFEVDGKFPLYITHPAEVANLVRLAGLDDEVVAAAWLHDVVEDCNVTVQSLSLNFGERVGRIVEFLSDDKTLADKGINREERKRLIRIRYTHIHGQDAIDVHTIKACDVLVNQRSFKRDDPKYFRDVTRDESILLLNALVHAQPNVKNALCDVLEIPHANHSKQRVWVLEKDRYVLAINEREIH